MLRTLLRRRRPVATAPPTYRAEDMPTPREWHAASVASWTNTDPMSAESWAWIVADEEMTR